MELSGDGEDLWVEGLARALVRRWGPEAEHRATLLGRQAFLGSAGRPGNPDALRLLARVRKLLEDVEDPK